MAVVGLERTSYEVDENEGSVEVCAVIIFPLIDCPVVLPFDVGFTTSDNTAGIHV